MKLLDDLRNALSDVVDRLESFFSAFFGAAVHAVEAGGGELLVTLATSAVAAAEATPGGGSAKFDAAKASVLAGLSSAGVPILKNAVHIAIETAVANLRAGQVTS